MDRSSSMRFAFKMIIPEWWCTLFFGFSDFMLFYSVLTSIWDYCRMMMVMMMAMVLVMMVTDDVVWWWWCWWCWWCDVKDQPDQQKNHSIQCLWCMCWSARLVVVVDMADSPLVNFCCVVQCIWDKGGLERYDMNVCVWLTNCIALTFAGTLPLPLPLPRCMYLSVVCVCMFNCCSLFCFFPPPFTHSQLESIQFDRLACQTLYPQCQLGENLSFDVIFDDDDDVAIGLMHLIE